MVRARAHRGLPADLLVVVERALQPPLAAGQARQLLLHRVTGGRRHLPCHDAQRAARGLLERHGMRFVLRGHYERPGQLWWLLDRVPGCDQRQRHVQRERLRDPVRLGLLELRGQLSGDEHLRSTKVRLRRAATRLGVELEIWDAENRVYFRRGQRKRGRPRKNSA